MQRKLNINLFTDDDLKIIHNSALKILSENGITFDGRALEIFKKNNFKVVDKQVYFTQQQIDTALKACPQFFTLKGRQKKYDLELGSGKDFGVPGPIGPIRVTDIDTSNREGTLQDIINFSKIYQASDVVNINSNGTVEATDVPESERHLRVLFEMLKHCTKPFYTKILPYDKVNDVMDMLEIALDGEGSLKTGVYMGIASAPALSPLAWDETTTDCIIAVAERGQFVTLGTGIATGVTGPIKVLGTLIMQNAELLSGIVLTQLVNKGTPVGYGTGAMAGNMKSAKYGCGSPTRMFIQFGTIEIGKRLYNLPSRTLTYGTDSTSLDYQMGVESYEGTFAGIVSQADYMLSEIGTIEGLLTVSYEKTILDEELTQRMLHIRNGLEVSEESASVDTILEIGSGGEYITSDDTLDNFHDEWYPKYTSWDANFSTRPENDYQYALRNANKEWKSRLDKAPESMISKETEEKLLQFINTKITN